MHAGMSALGQVVLIAHEQHLCWYGLVLSSYCYFLELPDFQWSGMLPQGRKSSGTGKKSASADRAELPHPSLSTSDPSSVRCLSRSGRGPGARYLKMARYQPGKSRTGGKRSSGCARIREECRSRCHPCRPCGRVCLRASRPWVGCCVEWKVGSSLKYDLSGYPGRRAGRGWRADLSLGALFVAGGGVDVAMLCLRRRLRMSCPANPAPPGSRGLQAAVGEGPVAAKQHQVPSAGNARPDALPEAA